MMRTPIQALLLVSTLAMAAPRARAAEPTITPRDGRGVPPAVTTPDGTGVPVSGLSGISHAGAGVFWAVMDHGEHLVRLSLDFDAAGNVTGLRAASGPALADDEDARGAIDREGIAYTGRDRHSVFVVDEESSAIVEFDLASGRRLRALPVPRAFVERKRRNYGFESLALDPTGQTLWTANEEALEGDGPRSSPANGSRVRLLRFERDGTGPGAAYRPAGQFVYKTEPIHGATARGARSGLADLVALLGGRLLALERSASSLGFQSRIYEIDLTGATDVTAFADGVDRRRHVPVTKRQLWKGRAGGWTGQNLEGLCLGPRLAGGGWALVGVVDNGDALLSTNSVVAFEFRDPMLPTPVVGVTLPPRAWWFLEPWTPPAFRLSP